MSTPVITVQNLSKQFRIPHEKISTMRGAFVNLFKQKTYEEFQALNDVSFSIKRGEFFGIVGRNGSGKSTLLKILAGIYSPDSGQVQINGRISPFLELGIGFNPELSGRDNVYLNGAVLGLSKKQIDEKFAAIVGFSELERFIDQKIKNYSSGMQVRLAFAVAIHANRDILLMDEVLAVGDANFQQKCIEQFNHYRNQGKTVVLVTHDLQTVQRYCDRAMLLRNGVVELIDDPASVVSRYTYQNMNDEEQRLADAASLAKTKKLETNPHSSVVQITGVEFLDGSLTSKKVFRTGDDITARIHYQASQPIERPVFGVAIHTEDGIHIAGPNSKSSGVEIAAISGKGFVDFTITNNPFFSNAYQFTAAIFDWDCVIPYVFHDRAYQFTVISGEVNQNGIVKLPHLWTIPKN